MDYRAEAITETAIKGVNIPSEQFHYALDNSRAYRRYVFNIMAKRLRTLCELVEEVRFRRLDNRVACLLYQLFSKSTEQALEITHQDLAQELGSSREVVSRLLKDIEKKGDCIVLHRGRIELLSLDKLGQYARTSSG